jgi:predicted esterase YcpF (UPF0227 family)
VILVAKMIVYLHGFGSSGSSSKVDALRDKFGAENVWAPDLPFDPDEVVKLVDKFIVDNYLTLDRLVFVGTSLGGFYASFFASKFDAPAVLVNPSCKPSESLKKRLGPNRNYATNEEFMVELAHLERLDSMRKFIDGEYNGSLVNLFVAKDDETIPYEIPLEYYTHSTYCEVVETGGHRFTDHWDMVLDRVAELV